MERRNMTNGRKRTGLGISEREILERKRQLRRESLRAEENQNSSSASPVAMSAQTNAPKKRSARPELGQRVSFDNLFLDEDDAYLDDAQDGFYLDEDEPSESRHRGVNPKRREIAAGSERRGRKPEYRDAVTSSEHRGVSENPKKNLRRRAVPGEQEKISKAKPLQDSGRTFKAESSQGSDRSFKTERLQDPERNSKAERLRDNSSKPVRTRRGKKAAKQKKGQPAERRAMTGREIIQSFLIRLVTFVVLVWVLFGVVFGITPMANADMQPAISAGDLMLYYRMERKLNSDDVVVFKVDGKQYTGRIVAKSGDTVEITSDSQLKVNGSIVVENDIFYSTPQYDTDVTYPLTLGEGEYFILCDSREGAKDSRYFGAVSKKEIKGKVITIIRRSGI